MYTGIARDVEQRLEAHASGKHGAKYLRGRSPFDLVFAAEVGDRSTAQKLEYRVKQLDRAAKLALINGKRPLPELELDDG